MLANHSLKVFRRSAAVANNLTDPKDLSQIVGTSLSANV
jgi:hypothetical protein